MRVGICYIMNKFHQSRRLRRQVRHGYIVRKWLVVYRSLEEVVIGGGDCRGIDISIVEK